MQIGQFRQFTHGRQIPLMGQLRQSVSIGQFRLSTHGTIIPAVCQSVPIGQIRQIPKNCSMGANLGVGGKCPQSRPNSTNLKRGGGSGESPTTCTILADRTPAQKLGESLPCRSPTSGTVYSGLGHGQNGHIARSTRRPVCPISHRSASVAHGCRHGAPARQNQR